MVNQCIRLCSLATVLSGLLLVPFATAQIKPCYFPDGSRATEFMACDITSEHSACCATSDNVVCLSSNLCYNQYGYIYRGACTDQTWRDAACPSDHCLDYDGQGMNFLACNDATGYWCCADGLDTPCCQNENVTQFYLNPGTVTYVREGLSTVDLTTVSSSASSTSAPATTTSSETSTTSSQTSTSGTSSATALPQTESGMTSGEKAGLAVGVVIPTIIALIFAFLWFKERKARRRLEGEHFKGTPMEEPILPPAPQPHYEVAERQQHGELNGHYTHPTNRTPSYGANVTELPTESASVKPPGWIGSN